MSALLGQVVQFVSTCWDRIVLNGSIERRQRPENLVSFFHDVVGIACIEPTVLEQRTNVDQAWVRRVTDESGIPVRHAPPAPPRGQRKEDVVQPDYRRLKDGQGIACVLTSMDQGRTFVSYTPRFRPLRGDADYRLSKACRKRFLHSYWYVVDPLMGPLSVRVASYFPVNVTGYVNGHAVVAQDLTRDGVRFRKVDNAVLAVADVHALPTAADRLSAASLPRRCADWVRRLVPTFSPTERAALAPG